MALADLLKIPSVQAYLLDESIYDTFEGILTKYHAEQAHRSTEFLDLTDAVLEGVLPIVQMPVLIAQAFGVDEATAKKMACDVAAARLLALEDFVPEVREAIVGWGGNPDAYPVAKVGKAKMTVEDFGNQIADRLGLDFSEVLVKRLGFLVKSYFAGERSRDSALTFFARATSIGGLGVGAEDAQRLMRAVDEMKDGVQIVDVAEPELLPEAVPEPVKEEPLPEHLPEIAPSHALTTDIPLTAKPKPAMSIGSSMGEAIDASHAKAAKRMERMAESVNQALEDAVNTAVEGAATTLAKKRIAKKAFADIARAFIRGVRDLFQTRDQLVRGFGLEGEDLEMLTEILEKTVATYHASGSTPAIVQSIPVDADQKPDVGVLDQRFAAMTKQMPAQPMESVLPGARVSAARSHEEETLMQTQKIDPAALEQAKIASKPAPVKPQLTVGSVPPPSAGGPKTVTDIRPTTRLMGPIDQLGAMTPAEFRRLSTAPAEAVQKIDDLLSSLEKQSYDDRVKGVKAWRKSPVNQLYLSMTAEALKTGVGIAEVASRRRAAGEESLSPAEVRAVAALNERTRF